MWAGGIATVLLPTTMILEPEGPKETGVPEMGIAGPPGIKVLEPTVMADADGLSVIGCPPTVIAGKGGGKVGAGGRATVLPPTTRMQEPEGPREIRVPETVMAGAPGTSV